MNRASGRRLRAARIAATIIATVGFSLLAAACGSSAGSHVAQLRTTQTHPASAGLSSAAPSLDGRSPASQMLAFSRCMRSHGEPKFPDPDAQGQIKQQLRASGIDENTSQYQAAAGACQRLLPNGGPSGTGQAEVQQEWSEFRSFTRCMHRYGVPTWPDAQPRSETDPRPIFPIQPVDPQSPIDPNSPQIKSKLPECDSLLKTANPNRL